VLNSYTYQTAFANFWTRSYIAVFSEVCRYSLFGPNVRYHFAIC